MVKLSKSVSPSEFVRLMQEGLCRFGPRRGVELPTISREQVVRDTIDAAFSLQREDKKREVLVKEAKILKQILFK